MGTLVIVLLLDVLQLEFICSSTCYLLGTAFDTVQARRHSLQALRAGVADSTLRTTHAWHTCVCCCLAKLLGCLEIGTAYVLLWVGMQCLEVVHPLGSCSLLSSPLCRSLTLFISTCMHGRLALTFCVVPANITQMKEACTGLMRQTLSCHVLRNKT